MSLLAESHQAFAAAVFDPHLPVPSGLTSLGQPAPEGRFAVYRNNVMVGLTEALRDAYPVVCRLVGDEFFAAMAGVFARAHPPGSPVMLDYGEDFAEFVADFPPAAGVPYLADVARLERAWVEAYHAADAIAVEPKDTSLEMHPAVRLVRSRFAILTIWQANQEDGPAPLELSDEGDNVLVTRPAAEVQACRISDGAADFIRAVAMGAPISTFDRAHIPALSSLGAFSR
jgi:hypothetical protein